MADQNTSLPVRTESAGDVKVQLVDKTITSQAAAVDSSGNVSVTVSNTTLAVTQSAGPWTANLTQVGGSSIALGQTTMSASLPVAFASNQSTLPVSAASLPLPSGASTSALQSSVQGTVGAGTAATNSGLVGAVFNSSAPTLTTGQQAALQSDGSGNLKVNLATALPTGANAIGSITNTSFIATQATAANLNATVVQGASLWISNISQFGGSAVVTGTGASGSGIPRVTVASDSAVLANIQVSGSAVSTSNPVPVVISASSPGTTVHAYNTAAAVAAGATSNHDYTVTAAKTFLFDRVWASASGKIKVEIQVETGVATAVFNTRFVGFNSTATPNIDLDVVSNLAVAAGVRVRVIRTNRDVQAQDLFSTIEGSEI